MAKASKLHLNSSFFQEQNRLTPIEAHRPTLSKRELESVLNCLVADQLGQGQITRRFERSFGTTFGFPHALALHSRTAAYHMALMGLEVGSEDHVILSPLSSESACDAARYVGASVHLIDVEKESFHPSQEKVLSLFKSTNEQIKGENSSQSNSTQKIVYIADHCFGSPIPYNLKKLRDAGLLLIEDFTGLVGSDKEGSFFGKTGDYGICGLSEYDLVTTGNGALLVTADAQLYKNVNTLRYGAKRETNVLGYDYRLGDFQTAMGLVQLSHLGVTLAQRKKIGCHYLKVLQKTKHKSYFKEASVDAYLRFPVYIRKEAAEVRRYFNSLQITISPVLEGLPLHHLLGKAPLEFPNAERLFRRCICLPLYPNLGSASIERISSAIRALI